jgi:3-oxoadipate enol-lactonase
MPFCQSSELMLYYEVHGEGLPLLLISGLGGGTWSWYAQVPYFERFYRTIIADNRGAGRSSMPPGPYRMEEFAADLLGLLDHLQVEQTLVMGLSMGGMIAQELALLAPQRVRALVLGCTHCGGTERIGPAPDVLARFADNRGLTQEQIVDKNIDFFFSHGCRETRPDLVAAYRAVQVAAPAQPEPGFIAQLEAIRTFAACSRLARITAPTLVVAGAEDVLVPAQNARLLVKRIPHAQLVEIPGAGHALHGECGQQLNALAHEFLRRVAG